MALFYDFGHIRSLTRRIRTFGAGSAGCQGGNMSEGVSPSPRGTRPGFSVNTHNLIGGLIVTVLALLMLGYAFYVPNTDIPRLMLAALAVIGIAAAVGLVPVHGPRDFYGGIALVMLPALALVASAELPGQRGFAFGPGSAPPWRSAASLRKGRRSKSTRYAARPSSLSLFLALPP